MVGKGEKEEEAMEEQVEIMQVEGEGEVLLSSGGAMAEVILVAEEMVEIV
jgi:uncharacterized protein (AIM24 family)